MKIKRLQKFVSIFSAIFLLVYSFTPYLSFSSVRAQSEDPQPTAEITPPQDNTPTPAPEVSPTIAPSPTDTPTPADTVQPTPTVDQVTPSPTDQSPPQNNSPPADNNNSSVTPPPTPSVTLSPTETPIQNEHGDLSAVLLPNTKADSLNLNLDAKDVATSASLVTDKADYAPTDTVFITGTKFNPGETYSLTISSNDSPAINFETKVTADASGGFLYAYQLDGNYRLNYNVEAKDASGNIVATVTFTDKKDDDDKKPDLTAKKTNDVGGNATIGVQFTWKIHIANGGEAKATFSNNQTILTDNLPSSGATYGFPSISNFVNISGTGAISCNISSNNLNCKASGGTVKIGTDGSFDVSFSVTPTIEGILQNPRSGEHKICKVDPGSDDEENRSSDEDHGVVKESDENNNTCSDRLTVTAAKGELVVHKVFTDQHSNIGITINLSWTGDTAVGETNQDGNATFSGFSPGTYTAHATEPTGYYESANTCVDVAIVSGQTTNCTITDSPIKGTITVTKYLDDNANGERDEGEKVLGDWEINLSGPDYSKSHETGDETGQTTFKGLLPGSYNLSETIKDGWKQSTISCDSDNTDQTRSNSSEEDNDNDNNDKNSHQIEVTAGADIHCSIGNYKKAKITVIKDVVGPDDENVVDTSTQFGFNIRRHKNQKLIKAFSLTDGDSETVKVKPGKYDVTENDPSPDYEFEKCVATYEGGSVGTIIVFGETVKVGSGDKVTVTCTNKQKLGKIIINKFDQNGGRLGGATFEICRNIFEDRSQFNGDGNNCFNVTDNQNGDADERPGYIEVDGLVFGDYTVTETQAPEGYQLDDSTCNQTIGNDGEVSLFNNNNSCSFFDQLTAGKLSISKSNDAPGDKAPGDGVTYTLTVTATDSAVLNTEVKDLLPDGFKYQLGSWTANSNLRGDLKAASITTEPTYASPGTWQLGNMSPGEVVTLTYVANISGNQQQGLYKDVAWSQGQSLASTTILANDPNPFVGTQVNVVTGQNTATQVSLNTKREETTTGGGEVLGASTGLPATGEDTLWVIIASILAALGGILVVIGFALKKGFRLPSLKFALRVVVLFSAVFMLAIKVHAADNISIHVSQPKSPTNLSSFNITFVALHTDDSALTVKCYKKGPVDGGFVQFGSDMVISPNSGNTGNCVADLSILTTAGTYSFKASANGVDSEIVSVDWNNSSNPGTPTNYSKGKIDSCTYQIKFRTADDSGKTVRVEVYRSTDTSFNLDNGTRVAQQNVGSSTDVTINNVVGNCGVDNFYAVRAFDSFGNGSGVVGDAGINVTFASTATGGTTTTATLVFAQGAGGTTGGAIAVGNANLPAGAQVLGTESAKIATGKPQQPGEALGAAAAQKGFLATFVAYLKNPYILLAILVLLIVVYALRKKDNKNPQ